MSKERIENFEAFWPFYLNEHALQTTRRFHFVGTTLGLLCALFGLTQGAPGWILFGLIPGYGFAWVSHFFIEKNKPASFSYPLWSFRADLKLWVLTLTGRIQAEVDRHVR